MADHSKETHIFKATIDSTGKGGVRRRLMRGFGATALGPITAAAIQLGAVPLLLHAWGAAKYGDWLLLSAVPSYLSLSDLGFGDASGSAMAMRVAANDRAGALEVFQSSWIFVTLISFVTLLLALPTVWWLPWQRLLRLSTTSNSQAAAIVIVLGAYVVVSQQNGVAESGYRSDGHFATGTACIMIQRLAETIIATLVAVMGGSPLAVAFAYLLARCAGTLAYIWLLLRLTPWIRYGARHARLKTIKNMAAPALGFMALPLGSALSLQGLILVIGARLGPIAVVSFSTLRSLSRVNFQLITVIKNAMWPELSRAFGAGDISLARRLHRYACQTSLGLSIGGGLLLWIFGPAIYRLWIHHNVGFDATCFHILLLAVVTSSLWDTSSVVPMSVNGHCRIATAYAAASLVSLGLAWILVPVFRAGGAALALLATDAYMTGLVLRTTLIHVKDNWKRFAPALFGFSHLWQTLQALPEVQR